MKQRILDLLKATGPLTLAEISDLLMWDEQLVEMVLDPLVALGDVHQETDGTFWYAQEVAA